MGPPGWGIEDFYHHLPTANKEVIQSWPESIVDRGDWVKVIVNRTWLSQDGGVKPYHAKLLREIFDCIHL
jgi:hypothetical protein